MKIIQHAAGAAVLALVPMSPVPAGAQTRVPVSASVRIADLNLSRAEGRATLHRRIAAAAGRACDVRGTHIRAASDSQRCYREMMADGARQIAGLSDRRVVELARLDPR